MSSFNAYYGHMSSVSPLVRQHLPSVEWLVSTRPEDRGTGRTTALALAFLRDSFSAGQPVPIRVFDHHVVQNDMNGDASRQWIVSKLQGMGAQVSHSGFMENQPYYPSSRDAPNFQDTLRSTARDFCDLVSAAIRLGLDPNWMISTIQTMLAETVILT